MYTEVKQQSIEELKIKAAEKISNLFKNAQENGKNTLLLLSGGSNLEYLDQVNPNDLNDHVTVSVLDERFTTDHSKNNLSQIEIKAPNLYKQFIEHHCKIIDTKVTAGQTRDDLAKRFNDEIVKWLNENPDGNVIITAGVGTDTHISGMKPLPKERFENLFESNDKNQLVVGYDASEVDADNPQRVTTTMNFFRRVKDIAHVIVYAVNKSDALRRVQENQGRLWLTPGAILNEMKNVTIFSN